MYCQTKSIRTVTLSSSSGEIVHTLQGKLYIYDKKSRITVPNPLAETYHYCSKAKSTYLDRNPLAFARVSISKSRWCYIFKEPPLTELGIELEKKAAITYLQGVHPKIQARALELVKKSYQLGIPIRFISGYRAYYPHPMDKKSRMAASWHNFGLALDFSIVEEDGKAISIKKIRASDKRWDMVGEMAVELGLIWGGTFKGKQKLEHKAHVEWHPGLPGRIDPLLLTKLLNHTGKSGENYQNVWNLLQESED
jgi:hypothetical protein